MSVKVVVLPCATGRFGSSCKAARQFSTNEKRPLNQSECKEGPFCWNHRKNILPSNGGSFRSYTLRPLYTWIVYGLHIKGKFVRIEMLDVFHT